jgi:hypothetical protein
MPASHYKGPVKGRGDTTMTLCEICSRYGIKTEASTTRTIEAQQTDDRIVGQVCDECASQVDRDASRQRTLGGLRIRATLVVE